MGEAKVVTITEMVAAESNNPAAKPELPPFFLGLAPESDGLIDVFESIYNRRKFVLLSSWRSVEAATSWIPTEGEAAVPVRHRQVRIIRDYGMFERREAPQFYPGVK